MKTATYSPEDNKLRLYATTRLPREVYDRVRAAGFIWAPKQGLFVAPVWTPETIASATREWFRFLGKVEAPGR